MNKPRSDDPAVALEAFASRYCDDNHVSCARYLLAMAFGRQQVPHDLAPDESHRALRLMRNTPRA